jgi:hypothetical protein
MRGVQMPVSKCRYVQMKALLAAVLLTPALASADDAFAAGWQRLRTQQPDGAKLVISVPKPAFYLGETIPLHLAYTSTQPRRFMAGTEQYDRVGRMNYIERFIVDPASFAEDPLRGLPGEQGGMGGLSGGPWPLSEKAYSFERILNEWARFRKPGRYRLYVLSHRVCQINGAERPYHCAPGPQPGLASNLLTLEIRTPPASWVKQQIAAATRILEAPGASDGKAANERTRAGKVLRFLDTPEAAAELAKHLGPGQDVDSYSMHMGVLGSPYRKELLPLLEQRLVAPDQPVWDRYLDTLAYLAELVASGGPMPSFPKEEQGRKAWNEESRRRAELRERKRNEYASRLFASLDSKQPQARAISMNTLLDSAMRSASVPPWFASIVASLTTGFRNLPVTMQRDLLEYRWSKIKTSAMIPVLRDLYAKPPVPRIEPPIEDIALRRLFELAPVEARQDLLAEIRNPTRDLRWATLAMLPDRALPELNDVFAARVEVHNPDERLLLRYATGEIVERVERAYVERNEELDRQKLPHCMSPLVFYFLQHDPAFGERELRRNLSTPGGDPGCYDIGFQFLYLGCYAMSPALERLAIEYLASPSVPLKRGAAEVLGKYGSLAAEEPLWQTMEYFHSWWKGREEQLKEAGGQEGMGLEQALRNALGQADGWVLQEADLSRLRDLCGSDWCKDEVARWQQSAKTPVRIGIMPGSDGFNLRIAQYDTASEEQFRRRLSQYPPGTTFRIVPFVSEDKFSGLKQARESTEQAVLAAHHRIAP